MERGQNTTLIITGAMSKLSLRAGTTGTRDHQDHHAVGKSRDQGEGYKSQNNVLTFPDIGGQIVIGN